MFHFYQCIFLAVLVLSSCATPTARTADGEMKPPGKTIQVEQQYPSQRDPFSQDELDNIFRKEAVYEMGEPGKSEYCCIIIGEEVEMVSKAASFFEEETGLQFSNFGMIIIKSHDTINILFRERYLRENQWKLSGGGWHPGLSSDTSPMFEMDLSREGFRLIRFERVH